MYMVILLFHGKSGFQGIFSQNIWNLDEMGCFWRALPEYCFRRKGSQCKGGKKAKEIFIIPLMANAAIKRAILVVG